MFTFVKEFSTYTQDFRIDKDPICTIDVSKCCLIEIKNKDEDGKKTVVSISHLSELQILPEMVIATKVEDIFKQYPTSSKIFGDYLQKNLEVIFSQFVKAGGDLSTCEITVLGGDKNTESKNMLILAINEYIDDKFLPEVGKTSENASSELEQVITDTRNSIVRFQTKPIIKNSAGHECDGHKNSTDYIFEEDRTTFRKAVLFDKDGIKNSDQSKDIVSKNLKTDNKIDMLKVENFQKRINDQYYPKSRVLDGYAEARIYGIEDAMAELIEKITLVTNQQNMTQNIQSFCSYLYIDNVDKSTGLPESVKDTNPEQGRNPYFKFYPKIKERAEAGTTINQFRAIEVENLSGKDSHSIEKS